MFVFLFLKNKKIRERGIIVSINVLQTKFNSQKRLFLEALKQKGKFLYCCNKRGYLYLLLYRGYLVTVGIKNGFIQVINIEVKTDEFSIELVEAI